MTCFLPSERKNRLYAFDLATKESLWEINHEDILKFVLQKEGVLLMANNENVYCHSMNDGRMLWEKEIASYGDYRDDLWDKDVKGDIYSTAVLVDDQLIVGVDQAKVISLDIKNGDIKWIVTLNDDESKVSLIYQEGASSIYVQSDHLYEIDIITGEVKRAHPIGEILDERKLSLGHLGISNSCLYIATSMRAPTLLALDKSSFEIKGTYALDDHCDGFGYPAIIGKYLTVMDYSKQLYLFQEVL